MPCVGLEPTIPASKRAKTYALDRSATVTARQRLQHENIKRKTKIMAFRGNYPIGTQTVINDNATDFVAHFIYRG
jgi:hypothetical protein